MKTKIRIFCWWTHDQPSISIIDRVLIQLKLNEHHFENFEFVIDDSYEWAVVFGKLGDNVLRTDKRHTIFFGMEPTWSHNIDRHAVDYSDWIFVQNRNIFDHDNEKVIEGPNYMLYGGGGDSEWGINSLKHWNLVKTQNISMIVSNSPDNMWWVPSDAPHIYHKRMNVANLIIKNNLPVDVYGRGWAAEGSFKGEVWNKNVALNSYRFSIGIENTAEKFYTTEKFTDCLLTNTIPIYFGSLNISEYYDSRGYIQLPDLDDLEKVKNIILEVHHSNETLYNSMLPFCLENKQIYLTKYNILNKIEEIITKGMLLV